MYKGHSILFTIHFGQNPIDFMEMKKIAWIDTLLLLSIKNFINNDHIALNKKVNEFKLRTIED